MLKTMLTNKEHDWSLSEILSECDWSDQAVAVGAGQGLADKGFARITEHATTKVRLAEQGQLGVSEGLLEARLWQWFKAVSYTHLTLPTKA